MEDLSGKEHEKNKVKIGQMGLNMSLVRSALARDFTTSLNTDKSKKYFGTLETALW